MGGTGGAFTARQVRPPQRAVAAGEVLLRDLAAPADPGQVPRPGLRDAAMRPSRTLSFVPWAGCRAAVRRRLYVFSEFVIFYSNYMGLGTIEKIRLDHIIDLKKSQKGGVPARASHALLVRS